MRLAELQVGMTYEMVRDPDWPGQRVRVVEIGVIGRDSYHGGDDVYEGVRVKLLREDGTPAFRHLGDNHTQEYDSEIVHPDRIVRSWGAVLIQRQMDEIRKYVKDSGSEIFRTWPSWPEVEVLDPIVEKRVQDYHETAVRQRRYERLKAIGLSIEGDLTPEILDSLIDMAEAWYAVRQAIEHSCLWGKLYR